MSTTSKPSRRVTALATLAFTSALTGGGTHAAAATTAQQRTSPPTPRSATRPPGSAELALPVAGDARLDLPSDLDLPALAGALGVHPGRLGAALRKLTPDETRSVGGLDPLTALANELALPPTDVYLAVARLAARSSRP